MKSAHQHSSFFPTLPVELGGYTLIQRLGSREESESFIARQGHVERRVVLEVLNPAAAGANGEATADFLATARARGAARLPHVTAVLESAVSTEGYAYICEGLPEGTPLSALAAAGTTLSPQQVCTLIRTAADLYEACAAAGLATAPLTADKVFMNREGAFTFLSPVLAGLPGEDESPRRQQALAETIRPVRPEGVPGQGRIATLLSWMQEGYEGEALDWAAIANTASLIAEQLSPEPILHINHPQRYDRGRDQRAGKRRRRQNRRTLALIGLALLTLIGMGVAGIFLAPESVPPIPALRGGYVCVKAEGKVLRVDAQPVSIEEYRLFLLDYAAMDAARRGSLTQDVPPTESDPVPANWQEQLAAPRQDAPATNMSYWQALMYARYKRAALPTATLLATARTEAGHPAVEEWTRDELPATAPYAAARLVLPAAAGASPIPENNPAARSPQRGFRLCR